MKSLTVFYDPHCGLCREFKLWLEAQSAYVWLELMAYDAPEVEHIFPGLDALHPAKEIIVLADDGRWWQGGDAWLTCLWALREYREWAFRLNTPLLRPVVRKACYMISQRRANLSAFLRLRSEAEVAEAITEGELPAGSCYEGSCKI